MRSSIRPASIAPLPRRARPRSSSSYSERSWGAPDRRRRTRARPSSTARKRSKRGPRQYRPPTPWLVSHRTSNSCCVDRRALDRVGIDGGQSGVVYLTCADPNHLLDRLHEDLPVAHFARPGGGQNRLHARFDEGLGAHHLDLHFFVEFHDQRRAAILLEPLVLTAVSADAAQRDARDTGPEQRRLDFGQAVGTYDRRDELHARLSVDWS